jgi:hypothetical protein
MKLEITETIARKLLLLGMLLFTVGVARTNAQEITDKTVATVGGGAAQFELITYSDLVWQLTLQPDTPVGMLSSDRLNTALQSVINQRLILQEAERLPGIAPTEKEIADELARLIKLFPSESEFRDRASRVGLTADQLREIIRQRVEINKYLDFRFRSFTVISPSEVTDYYNQVYVPRFRRRQPGRIVPTLDQVRSEIEQTLTESKIESEMQAFLESARDRAEIILLNPV